MFAGIVCAPQVQLIMDAGWKSSDSSSSWVEVEQL